MHEKGGRDANRVVDRGTKYVETIIKEELKSKGGSSSGRKKSDERKGRMAYMQTDSLPRWLKKRMSLRETNKGGGKQKK